MTQKSFKEASLLAVNVFQSLNGMGVLCREKRSYVKEEAFTGPKIAHRLSQLVLRLLRVDSTGPPMQKDCRTMSRVYIGN